HGADRACRWCHAGRGQGQDRGRIPRRAEERLTLMGRSLPTIRPAHASDAAFIARNILCSQRGPLPRGWFDIALGLDEPRCLAFVEKVATAQTKSWWHVSQFLIAEVEGEAAASLCALTAAGTGPAVRAAIEEVAGADEAQAIFRRGAYARGCWVQGGE